MDSLQADRDRQGQPPLPMGAYLKLPDPGVLLLGKQRYHVWDFWLRSRLTRRNLRTDAASGSHAENPDGSSRQIMSSSLIYCLQYMITSCNRYLRDNNLLPMPLDLHISAVRSWFVASIGQVIKIQNDLGAWWKYRFQQPEGVWDVQYRSNRPSMLNMRDISEAPPGKQGNPGEAIDVDARRRC